MRSKKMLGSSILVLSSLSMGFIPLISTNPINQTARIATKYETQSVSNDNPKSESSSEQVNKQEVNPKEGISHTLITICGVTGGVLFLLILIPIIVTIKESRKDLRETKQENKNKK